MLHAERMPIIAGARGAAREAARRPAGGLDPRAIIQGIEESASLPAGAVERFSGYAVIGLPFRSGHVLALRRFPASSIGPGYASVWHRDPEQRWTFYSTIAPHLACSRYFGAEVTKDVVAPIHLAWLSPWQFLVVVKGAITWSVTLGETTASRAMNAAARCVPESWWRKRSVLAAFGAAARLVLGSGRVNLAGRTPNGQAYISNPRQIWPVSESYALIAGTDPGPLGPLPEQARLRDFLIPQRGVFAVAQAFLQTR
jgi:hypothetical protein